MGRAVLWLLLFALNALAPPAVFAGGTAAAIQSEVEHALARLARLDPSQGFSYGAVDVMPNGDGYAVTVADVAMKLAAEDPGILDIGIVSFRLSPAGDEAYRVDRVTAANEFLHRGADGRADGGWRVVRRRLTGLWSRQQDGFLRRGAAIDLSLAITGLDKAVHDVAMAPPQAGSKLGWLQLMLFRSLARREATADGTLVDRYEISATEGGPVVVNGQPFELSAAALSIR
jgi:hypothetical protein